MAVFGLVALVIGLALFSQARSLPMFYAASLVIALGQSMASFPPFSARLMAWFVRKRGRAMGVLTPATAPATSPRRCSRYCSNWLAGVRRCSSPPP